MWVLWALLTCITFNTLLLLWLLKGVNKWLRI